MLVRQTCGGGGPMFLKLKCNQMRALQRKKPSRRLEIRFSGRTLKSTVFNEINRLCLLLKVVPQFFMELTTRVVVWYSTHIDTHRYRHTANALNRTGYISEADVQTSDESAAGSLFVGGKAYTMAQELKVMDV